MPMAPAQEQSVDGGTMYRVIYASRATAEMSDIELEGLLVEARMRNELEDLTGLLLYFGPDLADAPSFLQVLEGEREAVETVYELIARDRRHRDVRLVAAGDVEERMFPDWRMGLEYVTYDDLARAVPGLGTPDRPLVVMAELVTDPVRAEQLLVTATY